MSARIDYKALYEQSQVGIVALEQQLARLQKMIFGSRHERFIPADPTHRQLSLDITAESIASPAINVTRHISYTRHSVAVDTKPLQHPGGIKLPESLRVNRSLLNPLLIQQIVKRLVKRSPKC